MRMPHPHPTIQLENSPSKRERGNRKWQCLSEVVRWNSGFPVSSSRLGYAVESCEEADARLNSSFSISLRRATGDQSKVVWLQVASRHHRWSLPLTANMHTCGCQWQRRPPSDSKRPPLPLLLLKMRLKIFLFSFCQ